MTNSVASPNHHAATQEPEWTSRSSANRFSCLPHDSASNAFIQTVPRLPPHPARIQSTRTLCAFQLSQLG